MPADVNGGHALAAALDQSKIDIAHRLLDAGADPKRFGSEQASPLVSAARLDRAELVSRLLDKGALADQLDGSGRFALRAAAREGASSAIAQLLAHGASPGFTDAKQQTAIHGLIEPDEVPIFSSPKNRPLNAAHFEGVRLLAAAGLPLDARDGDGDSVLTSNFGHGRANMDLVHALLAAGARPGASDLGGAIELDDPALLRVLLARRNPGSLPTTLLLQAADHLESEPDLAVALLEDGVELPGDVYAQRQLLVEAARSAEETTLGILLSRGLPLAADPQGEALEAAMTNGRPKSVALLALRGADLRAKDSSGRTALHRMIAEDVRGNLVSRIDAPRPSCDYGADRRWLSARQYR